MKNDSRRYAAMTTAQKVVVNLIGAAMLAAAVLGGIAFGASVSSGNPASADTVSPTSAPTTATVACVLCHGPVTGSGGNVGAPVSVTGHGGSGGGK